MHFLLIAIGTRGDIEPFIAMGELLESRGHQVVYSFPEQLCALLPHNAIRFPLSKSFIEMVDSPEGRTVMTGEGGLLKRLKSFFNLYKWGMQVNKILVKEQQQVIEEFCPDRIIYHPKSTYPLIYGMLKGKRNIIASPVPYVVHTHDEHAHLGFGGGAGNGGTA
jgi:sterol 3beta-glucosyltransferase